MIMDPLPFPNASGGGRAGQLSGVTPDIAGLVFTGQGAYPFLERLESDGVLGQRAGIGPTATGVIA